MADTGAGLTGSPIPLPGIYKEQQAQAQKAYQTSLANINQRRQAMLSQYGMQGTVDAQGAYSNFKIDPTAQYGNLQMMKQTQGQALDQAYNAADDRGLGHTGLGAQGESLLKYTQGAESQALGRNFVQGMGDLSQSQVGAQDTLAQAMYQAEADARTEAINQSMFTQAPYGDVTNGTGAGGSAGSLNDFMYGTTVPGYSDEELFAAANASAPAGQSAAHIMHNGEVTVQNGVRGIYVKYISPGQSGGNTIWIPLPDKNQAPPAAPPTNTAPPPTTASSANIKKTLAAVLAGVTRKGVPQ